MTDKEKLRAFLEHTYDAMEKREAEGEKPHVPPDISTAFADIERVNEFTRLCRNQPAQVLAWIRELERMTKEPVRGAVERPSFKASYGKLLDALKAHIEGLSDKEATDVLRDSRAVRNLLPPGGGALGALAVRQQQSRAAAKKRGPGPLKRAIAVITEDDGAPTLDDLLEVFENDDRMEDMYRSASSPIDITAVEVNRDAGVVLYNTRRQSPTERRKASPLSA